ncbi:formin-like protein 6 [Iris pallida]|nr:formin-like protein 6 [Iris pallida]KAJ6805360.1 formin-like protein 6 [Iris pallida]
MAADFTPLSSETAATLHFRNPHDRSFINPLFLSLFIHHFSPTQP